MGQIKNIKLHIVTDIKTLKIYNMHLKLSRYKLGNAWKAYENLLWSHLLNQRYTHSLPKFPTKWMNLPFCELPSRRLQRASYGCFCSLFPEKVSQRPRYRGYSWFSSQGIGLQNAINEAEKLVGYPTTFNSWKYLFDEEPATFIGLARKIVGSGHPLLKTARDILSQDPNSSSHLGGLWVLLVSKAAGVNRDFDMDVNYVEGIHHKQRILAETTELINTAFLIHRNMVDLSDDLSEATNKKSLEFGNKLFILGGDYLLSKASLELAKIENTDVVALIGQSIGDMAEGGSIEVATNEVSDWTIKSWEHYIFLLKGSLMANSCKSSSKIVGHSDDSGNTAYDFGKNLVFAQHCSDDIESFFDKKQVIKRTNYVVITAMQNNPGVNTFIKNSKDIWTNLEANGKLKSHILDMHPDVIVQAKQSCQCYINNSLNTIALFPELGTVKTIETILKNISEG